jgi:hypothetical protein
MRVRRPARLIGSASTNPLPRCRSASGPERRAHLTWRRISVELGRLREQPQVVV